MRNTRIGMVVRWTATLLSVTLVLLYVANVPFYSGSRIGAIGMWRMEHGRLRVERSVGGSTETFYIAANSEGLRFWPEGRWVSMSEWMVNVPLWMPLVGTGAIAGWAWRGWWRARGERGARGTRCGRCGYALAGLRESGAAGGARVCPECGGVRRA